MILVYLDFEIHIYPHPIVYYRTPIPTVYLMARVLLNVSRRVDLWAAVPLCEMSAQMGHLLWQPVVALYDYIPVD